MRGDKPVIGLVGGVGSGKSTVADLLAEMGLARIDGDRIGHEILARPEVRRQVIERFGPDVLDAEGAIDRKLLGRAAFADPDRLAELNAIMQPRIRAQIERRIAAARQDPEVPAVVLDAAILLEAGWDDLCSDRVFIRSDEAQRLDRVGKDRGWDEAVWREREKSQFAVDRKAAACSYELDNRSSVSNLPARVRELFQRILHPADPPA
jgi:dephospho-CoA kinase